MKRLLLLLATIISLLTVRASNENVVIENFNDIYRVIPAKDGKSVKEIKNSVTIDFRARRTAGNAFAEAFYNDCISIDKASGGEAVYGMTEDDDVFYSDARICRMKLPLKKAGDKATARFERTFKDPKYFSRTALAQPYDVENYKVSFIIPRSLAGDLQVLDRQLPSDAVRTVTAGDRETTITYTLRNVKSPASASRRVPSSLTWPTLYLKGVFADHNDLYRYLHSLVTLNPDPDSAKVVALAREVTEGLTTDSAKIAAIYDYVHDNIRYIAVEHGIYSHMPDLPSEVLRKHYGDCKGSAGLIRAMLRGAGIDGRFVWIGTKSIPTDWTEYPLLCSGNHMIAAAVTGDSILYLDGTATYCPIDQIPTFIRGRQTLVEDNSETCIVGRVPEQPVSTDSYTIDTRLSMGDGATLKAEYSELATGRFNSSLLGAVDATIESKRHDALEEYLLKSAKGSRVESVTLDRSRQGSVINAEITLNDAVQMIGDELFVNLNPYFSVAPISIDTKGRPDIDASIGFPFSAKYHSEYVIPDGYTIASVPDNTEISNQWFDARIDYNMPDDRNVISMTLDLNLNDTFVPAAGVKNYAADVRDLKRAASVQLHLKKSE